jgi:hypothetical protein
LALAAIPLVPLPWIAAQLAGGDSGWIDRYLLHQVVALPFEDQGAGRDLGFVPRTLLKTYWPWLAVVLWAAVQAIRRGHRSHAEVWGFALWVALAFTVARRKPDYYLLPLYPALAILAGDVLARGLHRGRGRAVLAAVGAGGGCALAVVLAATGLNLRAGSLERESAQIAALAPALRADPPALLGLYAVHQDRAEWALAFYVDLPARPVRLESAEAASAFLEVPGRLVLAAAPLAGHAPRATAGPLSLVGGSTTAR